MKIITAYASLVILSSLNIFSATSIPSLTSSFKPVTSAGGSALCAVGDWLAEFTTQPAAGGACVPLAAQCGWACSKTESCAYFNSWTTTGRCELFADGTFNATILMDCMLQEKIGNVPIGFTSQTSSVTTDPISQVTSISTGSAVATSVITATTTESNCASNLTLSGSSSCSFPFTYNGNLHYSCIEGISYNKLQNQLACLAHNWSWIACPACQANFTAHNITMGITIPTLNGKTRAMTVNGWIIFQQQLVQSSTPATLSFNQNWTTFSSGFGTLGSNYYMGNEKVHLLTQAGTTYRLRIEMLFPTYGWMSAEYDQFSIDNETELYRLHVANYSNGECGDSLQYITPSPNFWYQNGMPFSTKDKANDNSAIIPRCASEFSSGFWYNNCYWALVWGDTPSAVGWWTHTSSPNVTQSRMMIKASG